MCVCVRVSVREGPNAANVAVVSKQCENPRLYRRNPDFFGLYGKTKIRTKKKRYQRASLFGLAVLAENIIVCVCLALCAYIHIFIDMYVYIFSVFIY